MKVLLSVMGVLLIAVLVFAMAGVLATWAPDKSVEELSKKWAQAPSFFVSVDGMQVHVRDEGPRDDPSPIVLLHGTSSSLHTWEGWVQGLKNKRRVIRMDLPAFGLTGPNIESDYSTAAYVRFVGHFLDSMGIKNCVLGGNSLGGQIAWAVAVAMPERVGKLVLVDAGGYPLEPKSIPIGFQIARVPGVGRVFESILPRGIVESSVRNVYGDPAKVQPALVDLYYDMALRSGNRKALVFRIQQGFGTDSRQIYSLKIPTLIVWGGKDLLIPVESGKRFAQDIEGSKLVVFDDLGHVPHEEDPQSTLAVVKTFLDISD